MIPFLFLLCVNNCVQKKRLHPCVWCARQVLAHAVGPPLCLNSLDCPSAGCMIRSSDHVAYTFSQLRKCMNTNGMKALALLSSAFEACPLSYGKQNQSDRVTSQTLPSTVRVETCLVCSSRSHLLCVLGACMALAEFSFFFARDFCSHCGFSNQAQ